MKFFNNLDRIKRLEEAASAKYQSVYFADLESGKYTVYGHNFPKKVFTEKEFKKLSKSNKDVATYSANNEEDFHIKIVK